MSEDRRHAVLVHLNRAEAEFADALELEKNDFFLEPLLRAHLVQLLITERIVEIREWPEA